MGSQPGTVVSLNNTPVGTIGAGETLRLADIQRGDVVTTSNPAQATLITGDVGSTYEMRWYALAPREQWSDDYYTPVYTPTGEEATRVWLYNPNDDPITVTMSTATNATFQSIVVPAGQSVLSNAVPDAPGPGGSGARFFTANGADFFALTQTDTNASGSTGGQIYDWGHPLIPANELTSQALIGLGYGNTSNNPAVASRSVVWVTPLEDATISVDYDGNGTIDATFEVGRLESLQLVDPNDNDMSGALIFATDGPGSDVGVDIAVAWGQDPEKSFSGDGNGLDLGTVVLPLPELTAGKSATFIDTRWRRPAGSRRDRGMDHHGPELRPGRRPHRRLQRARFPQPPARGFELRARLDHRHPPERRRHPRF